MRADVPHIAVDRIVPVYLGRDMEFVLARVQPNPPAQFFRINEQDETPSPESRSATMEIVGRVRLGTEEAAEAAMGILSLLASTQEIDIDELEKFTIDLRAKAERIELETAGKERAE